MGLTPKFVPVFGKTEKTIPTILQEVVDAMCHDYCKWPELWVEEARDGQELSESDICANCPLNRLV